MVNWMVGIVLASEVTGAGSVGMKCQFLSLLENEL